MAKIKGCQIAKIQKAAKKNQKAHLFFLTGRCCCERQEKGQDWINILTEQRDSAAIHRKKKGHCCN